MLFGKFTARTTTALALAGMLGACATAPGGPTPTASAANRAAVIARADERGALLVRGDLDAAYAFLSEGSKAVISLDNFKRRMSVVMFTAYRVDDASCDAESCGDPDTGRRRQSPNSVLPTQLEDGTSPYKSDSSDDALNHPRESVQGHPGC